MGQPVPYNRIYDFGIQQPIDAPAYQLEAELNAIEQTLDETLANLALIQRDDGKLVNSAVHIEALDTAVKSLIASVAFQVRGAWTDGEDYSVGDIVINNQLSYLCHVAHTASATINTSKFSLLSSPALPPSNPGDDDKFLRASGGIGTWADFTASMITDVVPELQSVMTAANVGAARTALGITSAGDAIATAASAAAQRTALGISSFIGTLVDDADAPTARSTLGINKIFKQSELGAAAALTHIGEDFVFSYRNSTTAGNDIYNAMFPGIDHYDVVQGVLEIADGSTIEHATGVAGYVKNLDASTNGVALFGAAYVDVDNGKVWGLNTLLSDDAVRVAGTDLGRMLLNELDFNIMHPDTEVIGLSLGGNSLSQPNVATAFIANVLGSNIQWSTAFSTMDNAAQNALGIGLVGAAGANVSSQKIIFSSTDGSSVKQTAILQAQAGGFLVLDGLSAKFNLKISGANLFLDTGQSVTINGNQVLSDRATGWQLPTGTITRTTFDTATVTLPQLAERVYGLINDFYSKHGSIGA